MKLAALGVVTVVIGLLEGISGLVGIGGFWILMGWPAWVHGRELKGRKAAAGDGAVQVDGRTFARGTALLVGVGVPSLVVGLLELGIDADDDAWRWLPIGVGILTAASGVLGAVLYLLAQAATRTPGGGHGATIPATIWIRGMTETGTYINERPRLTFELEVVADDDTVPPYRVTKKATVPVTAMGSLRVGEGFRAMVHGAEDPASMDIRWDEPVSGGGDRTVAERLASLEELRRAGSVSDDEYEAQRRRILGSI